MGAGAAVGVGGVYLDASAVVKLLVPERESTALLAFLGALAGARLERDPDRGADLRLPPPGLDPAIGRELLSGLMLLPMSADVIERACVPFSPPQRALDALHLATAQIVADDLDWFVTYDKDQAAAAARLGWRVRQPADDPA